MKATAQRIQIKSPGLHHVALRSSDLARAKLFYIDRLGFPLLLDTGEMFIFAGGNTAIAVRGPDKQTPDDDSFNPSRVGLDHLALGCSDVAELRRVADALLANGIQNTGVKTDDTLGKQYVAFKDPDGIAWELYMV